MKLDKLQTGIKPPNDLLPLQIGGLDGDYGEIRGPGIIHNVIANSVIYRIIVNIKYQMPEIPLVIYGQSFKGRLKQASCSAITNIEGSGISIKQIAKLLGWVVLFWFGINDVFLSFFGLDETDFLLGKNADQKMEMVFHEYPGKSTGYRGNMFVVQPKEMLVIVVFQEDIASINASVEDMVITTRL